MDANLVSLVVQVVGTSVGTAAILTPVAMYAVRAESAKAAAKALEIARAEARAAALEAQNEYRTLREERAKLMAELREHIEEMFDLKLSLLPDQIMARVNGAYVRGPEQRAVNENVVKELSEQRAAIGQVQLAIANLGNSLIRRAGAGASQ